MAVEWSPVALEIYHLIFPRGVHGIVVYGRSMSPAAKCVSRDSTLAAVLCRVSLIVCTPFRSASIFICLSIYILCICTECFTASGHNFVVILRLIV